MKVERGDYVRVSDRIDAEHGGGVTGQVVWVGEVHARVVCRDGRKLKVHFDWLTPASAVDALADLDG